MFNLKTNINVKMISATAEKKTNEIQRAFSKREKKIKKQK